MIPIIPFFGWASIDSAEELVDGLVDLLLHLLALLGGGVGWNQF
jgi:hypothetical protein